MPETQSTTPNSIRLNRYIAQCGIASRRGADELIESGQVTVNGHKISDFGMRVNPATDHIGTVIKHLVSVSRVASTCAVEKVFPNGKESVEGH